MQNGNSHNKCTIAVRFPDLSGTGSQCRYNVQPGMLVMGDGC